MCEGMTQGTSVRMRKPSVSEYHYSIPSTSVTDSGLGMEEEIKHLFTWIHGNQNLPSPSRALKNPTVPRSLRKNLSFGRSCEAPSTPFFRIYTNMRKRISPQSDYPFKTEAGMEKGGNRDALQCPHFWTHIPCSLGEGCQPFSSLFPLLSDNFSPSAINVDAVTFHNRSSLQAPFHGCWSKNRGIAVPHSPCRDSWSLGGPIAPSGLSA